jgi:hypothetical protein
MARPIPVRQLLSKLRQLPRPQQRLLLEAGLALAFARLALLLLPFKLIMKSLGQRAAPLHTPPAPVTHRIALAIGWAVTRIAPRTPWQSRCLAQALAAKFMLRRRSIPSTLYLGVAKADEHPTNLQAHAWIQCGDIYLTGAPGRERFTPLACFIERNAPPANPSPPTRHTDESLRQRHHLQQLSKPLKQLPPPSPEGGGVDQLGSERSQEQS